jgi:hypothetical protein
MSARRIPFLKSVKSLDSRAICERAPLGPQLTAAIPQKSLQNSEANHKKAGAKPVPATIQTVKHQILFPNTATLHIGGAVYRGMTWRRALGEARWHLIVCSVEDDLTGFVFGK